MQKVQVIDSHTGGEPTRVVIGGGPDLGHGPLSERRQRFKREFDSFRRAIIHEPRGSELLVGAYLVEPYNPQCDIGVIFFNNVGMLGMCGHATIGLAVTLAYLGKQQPGTLRLDTPVGVVEVDYHGGHTVSFINVPSYRYASNITLELPGIGTVSGDIAYGGNWFYVTDALGQCLESKNAQHLVALTREIRKALQRQGVTGANGAEIDHIELIGTPAHPRNHARSFVLCPGGAYDRSPCGTGTSAKLACLAANGTLAPGEPWRQEGILGSVFEGCYTITDGHSIRPRITGEAYVTGEVTLLFDPSDPFREGIPQ